MVPPTVPQRRVAPVRQDTPSASDGRGLARGLVYTREGTLVASVMQEGVIRKLRTKADSEEDR
ncbi:MAG: thioesterase family protein [Microthrixaceae bacterium]